VSASRNPAFRGAFLRPGGVSTARWRGLTSGKLTICLGPEFTQCTCVARQRLGALLRNLFLAGHPECPLLTQGRHEKLLRNKRGDDENLEMSP
jgi:hypothetical protein